MKRWLLGALALVVWLGVVGAQVQAQDSPPPPQDQNLITMNFQDVDITVLAKFISEITGKNFVVDESVRGKATILSPTKVTPEQAFSIFQSVLQVKGFATVQAGPVIKIVPSREVRESAALTTSQEPGEARGDAYVTRMVRLKNIDATSLVNVVQPMVSHDGLVAAFPEDNTLILTDDAYNIDRLLRIIGSLDVQGTHQNIEVIPLQLAFADDLASQVEKIMGGEGSDGNNAGRFPRPGLGVVAPSAQGPSGGFKVVPDERTNSLIVLAGPVQMRAIKELVAKLDVHPPNENTRIHVYHLQNASAGEIVQVLNGLLGGGGGPSTLSPVTGRNSLGRGGSGLSSMGGFNSGFGGGGMGGNGGGFGGSSFGGMASSFGGYGSNSSFGGSMGSPMASRSSNNNSSETMTASGGGSKSPDFENPVTVTADPATNSLIISAAPQDYQNLERVIADLDVPRIQVFVQAIIVEVSAERARDIGVNWQGATNISGSTIGVGQLNFGTLQNALTNPLGMTGLGVGLASGSQCTINTAVTAASAVASAATGTTAGTVTVPCDIALMTALQTDTHSNVLSAPTLLTADNEEATIVVGENLPFVGSASATSALSGQIFNSVDRQNVGITLDIIPQVSQGDYVRLDIYEEVSNVVAGTINQVTNPLGPTTTIRSASTTVMVQDHRTAVIGGLLSNESDIQRSAVPFLSDIPVIGNLFSENGSDKKKLNLLLFLTPHVVRTHEDLRALALDERQKFTDALGRREMHQMPMQQYRELYQPTFGVPVSPAQDLRDRGATMAPSAGVGFGSMPSSMMAPSSSTPLNAEEIGPSSKASRPPSWLSAPSSAPAASAPSSAPPTTVSPMTVGSSAPISSSATRAAVPAGAGADRP